MSIYELKNIAITDLLTHLGYRPVSRAKGGRQWFYHSPLRDDRNASFCVSTDKAANPVNIMGASKRVMEDLIMAYTSKFPVTTARFANVAVSHGSLPASGIDRVMKKQPLVAPIDVKRYFVSPEESGQICMLACMLGNNGEIFFPKY